MSPPEGTGQEREENIPRTVQICVPSKLVMDLLAQGAILQVQIGPVHLRPDLARPAPRPESPESTNPRPEAETSTIRPNVEAENSRPNPSGSGGSENDITRPERPSSRHPSTRPVSPFTDWSSLSDNNDNDVISVHSDGSDANYVPRSPVYEPESPSAVHKRDNYRNRASDRDSNERPRSPLAEDHSFKGFPLSLGELAKGEDRILKGSDQCEHLNM